MGFDFQGSDIVPQYQDITFNLHFPTKNFGSFTLFGIGGLSEGGTLAERDSSAWETAADRLQNRVQRKVGVLGATYTYLLPNNKTYFKLVGAFTIEDGIFQRDSLGDNYAERLRYRDHFANSAGRFSFLANHKFSAQHMLRFGLTYDRLMFRSEFEALDGVLRNSRFDRNYILNLVGGKEFAVGKNKDHILGANAKLVWAGGNRTTPIDLIASQTSGREVLIAGTEFTGRLPAYFRFDLGASYRWNRPRSALVVAMEVQNVSNRLNVEGQHFDPYSGRVVQTRMLGIIPILNVRVEF